MYKLKTEMSLDTIHTTMHAPNALRFSTTFIIRLALSDYRVHGLYSLPANSHARDQDVHHICMMCRKMDVLLGILHAFLVIYYDIWTTC